MGKLSGKVALVTGGSRGIGAGIAERLAEDGADVAITYVSSAGAAEKVAEKVRSLGGRAFTVQADAADVQSTKAGVDKVVSEFGKIDILVNNAGVYEGGPLDQLTVEQFDRVFNINVRAVLFAAQAAASHMKPGGRVINIGSCLGTKVPDPEMTIYAATKSALIGLTKGLARDLGSRGVTVNLIQPGPIDTDANPANGPQADHVRSNVLLGRYGVASEVAAMVALLASDDGAYLTGASIDIDGGANV